MSMPTHLTCSSFYSLVSSPSFFLFLPEDEILCSQQIFRGMFHIFTPLLRLERPAPLPQEMCHGLAGFGLLGLVVTFPGVSIVVDTYTVHPVKSSMNWLSTAFDFTTVLFERARRDFDFYTEVSMTSLQCQVSVYRRLEAGDQFHAKTTDHVRSSSTLTALWTVRLSLRYLSQVLTPGDTMRIQVRPLA